MPVVVMINTQLVSMTPEHQDIDAPNEPPCSYSLSEYPCYLDILNEGSIMSQRWS